MGFCRSPLRLPGSVYMDAAAQRNLRSAPLTPAPPVLPRADVLALHRPPDVPLAALRAPVLPQASDADDAEAAPANPGSVLLSLRPGRERAFPTALPLRHQCRVALKLRSARQTPPVTRPWAGGSSVMSLAPDGWSRSRSVPRSSLPANAPPSSILLP